MKYLSSIAAVTALILMVGCNQYQSKKTSAPAKLADIVASADTTIYVVLESCSSNTLEVTSLETAETIQLTYSSDEGKETPIRGELNIGDTLAVTYDHQSYLLANCVNISELLGLWLFEDSDGEGIKLNANGTAQSIGIMNVRIDNWFIHNGKLVLTYVEGDGSDYVPKADTTGILTLDADRLEISVGGMSRMAERQPALLTR